jgi:formate dehydrogenase subunit gamma
MSLPERERDAVQHALAQAQAQGQAQGQAALLPVLHAVQERLGWITPAVVPLIAQALNLSRADVHGVITFYSYFRRSPPGKQVIYLCRAEACQAVGARQLAEHVRRVLGADFHGCSRDGRYTLEPVYCLGNCALSPAVMIDRELYGRVTPEGLDDLLSEWERR